MMWEAARAVSLVHWLWIAGTWAVALLSWWFRGVESAGGVLLASFLLAMAVVYVWTATGELRKLGRRIASDWRGES